MDVLIGTSEGVFVAGKTGSAAAAEGLEGRSIRNVSAINGDLFAGADNGVYRSRDGGRSWKPVGVPGQMIWDIVPAPDDPRTLYAGSQPAGLFCSHDGGSNWSAVDSFLKAPGADRWCLPGQPPPSARARTIVLDPAHPERWRIGVEVGGVAITDDAGATWECSLPGGNPDIHVMANHPSRSGVVYATTGFGRIDNSEPQAKRIAGLFRSEDGGRTWTYLWEGIQPSYTRPICIDPRAPHAITVACAPTAFSSIRDEGGAKAMLYRSDDDGKSWRSLGDADHSPSAANFLAVAVDVGQAGSVLVGTETGEVWRVSGAGDWTLVSRALPAAQAMLCLA